MVLSVNLLPVFYKQFIFLRIVAQSAYVSDWFKSRELALGLAMTICIARSGTVVNYIISSRVYNTSNSLAFAFWVGTFMMGISLISGALAVLIDQHVEKKSKYVPRLSESKKISLKDLKNFSGKFWLVVGSLVGFYTAFLCFVNISVKFAQDKFNIAETDAGILAVFF